MQHAALGYTTQSKSMYTDLAIGANWNNSIVDTPNIWAHRTTQNQTDRSKPTMCYFDQAKHKTRKIGCKAMGRRAGFYSQHIQNLWLFEMMLYS